MWPVLLSWIVPATAAPSSEEVRIPAEGLELAGTLSLPGREGPVPGIVLVHGSGPQSRDEVVPGQLNVVFGFDVPVFAQLSDALVDAGYAVLRYDKRTCGPFNGCRDNGYPPPPADLTVDTFVADAAAALAWLGQRPEVDAEALVVIGHSQGATFVPGLAGSVDGVRAGVVIAGNLRPIDAVVAGQLEDSRALLATLGAPSATIEQALAPLQTAVDDLERLRAGERVTAPILGAPAPFWASWLAQADRVPAEAKASPVPLLVLGGSLDTNVPPRELDPWRDALPGGRGHVVQELACVSHALTCITADSVPTIRPADLGRSVDPSVTGAITSFLSTALSR